jgi:hypothetical protein
MAKVAAAGGAPGANRLDRRKARTRQALIDAAVRLIAEGRGGRASGTRNEWTRAPWISSPKPVCGCSAFPVSKPPASSRPCLPPVGAVSR